MNTKGRNEYNEELDNPANYVSSSDSEYDLVKKFPVSSSGSESESDKKAVSAKRYINRLTKPIRRTLKNTANAGITTFNFANRTRRRINQDADDRRVQARQDLKYARRFKELRNYGDSVTRGQSLLGRGMFSSLSQITESNGNKVYDNMMNDPIEPPKFELVRDFVNLNFLENIYLIVVRLNNGKELRIPVAAYEIDSVIQNGDDLKSFFSYTDFSFFPYEMIDDKLASLPTYAENTLNLNSMRSDIGIIAEIGEHFPSTTIQNPNGSLITSWQWDDNIANQFASAAILKNLTQIVEEEIKRKLTQGEEVQLYKYNLETGTKENLRVLEKQGTLHAPNVLKLLSQFTFGPNITNREDFLGKIHKIQGLPLTKEAKATNLQQNMLANQWAQQWVQPIGEAAAVKEPIRVQSEQQKAMAAARLAAFKPTKTDLGGALYRRTKRKTKRSKKYRKTNKRRSNKAKR
jgi:hypothetical protein